MIKSVPTPGFQYKVKTGDRLDFIETSAYGYKTNSLESANPQLSDRKISLEDRPTIYTGDILLIPLLKPKVESTIAGKAKDEMTIILNGKEILCQNKRLLRTMDTPSDGWTATIEWVPGQNEELDEAIKPQSYAEAQVYIGGKLKVNGFLYGRKPSKADQGSTVVLEGFSSTKDVIDSTMPTPYEQSNISLKDRANTILSAFGSSCVFDDGIPEDTELFKRVTGDITTGAGAHIKKLAMQRAYLCSSTPEGLFLFTRAKSGSPVDTLISGESRILNTLSANFDDTKVFSKITAIGESPGKVSANFTSTDEVIPKTRFKTVKADEARTPEKMAKWVRNNQYSESLSFPIVVNSWFTKSGELWEENTIVTVVAAELFIPKGFNFTIKNVEYNEDKQAKQATLSLVPSFVFTEGDIELPWRA